MKRITLITVVHFLLTAICIIGATYMAAEAVRAGAENIGLFGSILRFLALVLAQPAAITVFDGMAKDSAMLWPILVLNSFLWSLVISFLWSKIALKRANANT